MEFMKTSDFPTTEYSGISGIYFNKIIDTIIKIGDLDKSKQTILDYGAGHGVIKSKLFSVNPSVTVINFDIKEELTEVDDWRSVTFNTLIANEVFM
jgi:2-polyprenyl-3-methyl-5-hydroxy-6-metoxy-1,4-benzoquinol methylase